MSLDLFFINKKVTTSEEVEKIRENEISSSDEHFISQEVMQKILDELKAKGLKFEPYIKENKMEASSESWSLSFSHKEGFLTIPYWESLATDEIRQEMNLVVNVVLDQGMCGFDPQSGEFVDRSYNFLTMFNHTLNMLKNIKF